MQVGIVLGIIDVPVVAPMANALIRDQSEKRECDQQICDDVIDFAILEEAIVA